MEEARHRLEFIVKPYRKGWEAGRNAAKRAEGCSTSEHENLTPNPESEPGIPSSSSMPEPQPPQEKTNESTDITPIPGDIVSFGGYDWRVLTVEKMSGQGNNYKAFLLSEEILEVRKFDKWSFWKNETSWETCQLRQYLNEDFYQRFSKADRSRIQETKVVNSDNRKREFFDDGVGYKDTLDKIFLLSVDEVMEYLEASKRSQGGQGSNKRKKRDWWLRTQGEDERMTAYVHANDESINLEGAFVADRESGVRPALWLKL